MRSLVLSLAFLGFTVSTHLSSLAQEISPPAPSDPNPAQAAPAPTPRGSVVGHVTCADTRTPARGARVMLMPTTALASGGNAGGGPLVGVTQLDGSFVVRYLPPGEYIVTAFAAGYLSPFDGISIDPSSGKNGEQEMLKRLRERAPVVTVTGASEARIDVEIRRGAVLSGRVLYSDGAPASQLSVSLEKVADEDSNKNSAQKSGEAVDVGFLVGFAVLQQPMTTDDQGHFRISGISPGKYRVAVPQSFENGGFGRQIGQLFGQANATKGMLTLYSGNTMHKKDAKVYELRAGDVVDDVDITLPLNGLHTIHGFATGKDGAQLNVGEVELTDTADPSISFHSRVRAGGEFHLVGIPEGSYNLTITGGRIFEGEALQQITNDDMVPFIEQTKKASRAFADTTQAMIVQSADIQNLTITLPDTKVPDPPNPMPQREQNP